MVTEGTTKPCAYTVVYDGDERTRYETSADPRTIGGVISCRNVVCKHVSDYDKETVGEQIETAFNEHEAALIEELGPR